MKIRDVIQALMEARNWNQDQLATALRTSQNNVSRWLKNTDPRGEMRDAIMQLAYESGIVSPPALSQAAHVAIMGWVGAGAEVNPDFEQVPPEGIEQVELPYPAPEGYIGFQVRGDSMMPKYDDGDIVLVSREQPWSLERMIGQEAVVRTDAGARYLKRIAHGPSPQTYNLESVNARTIVAARIVWASPVRMVVPNIGLKWLPAPKAKPTKGARRR
jgi:phage repressor protein C with HTH and peptisase S24 domain